MAASTSAGVMALALISVYTSFTPSSIAKMVGRSHPFSPPSPEAAAGCRRDSIRFNSDSDTADLMNRTRVCRSSLASSAPSRRFWPHIVFSFCKACTSASFAASAEVSSVMVRSLTRSSSSRASRSFSRLALALESSNCRCSTCSTSAAFSSLSVAVPPSLFCNRSISSNSCWIFRSFGSKFFTGLFWICFARSANLRVEIVSATLRSAGPMLATITVLEFPPRESFSSMVSGLLRYGMCSFPVTILSMTVPRADRERLILQPSFSASPTAPVFDCRSEPARSTRLSLETMCNGAVGSASKSMLSTDTVKTA
eukprot:RCo048851